MERLLHQLRSVVGTGVVGLGVVGTEFDVDSNGQVTSNDRNLEIGPCASEDYPFSQTHAILCANPSYSFVPTMAPTSAPTNLPTLAPTESTS